ncbi:hypothetical protein CC2G_000044 [Coprinopsis cinerea AmutBmut pab1-1]|nr:hypothetical protein CC2G_000044 [Coprinopsis cinerea AmutBmut pab1-1]
MLQQCSSLQSVDMDCIRNTMFSESLIRSHSHRYPAALQERRVRGPIVLPSLQSLTMSMYDTVADTFEPLLYLRAPSLKSLRLTRVRPDEPKPEQEVEAFILGQGWWKGDAGFRNILSLPILEDLGSFITSDIVGQETLEWLTHRSDDSERESHVLPKLHRFLAPVDAQDGILSEMIASRVLGTSRPVLRWVYADVMGAKDDSRRDKEAMLRLKSSLEFLEFGFMSV